MMHARVEGNAVSTICHPTLKGQRLLLCQPIDEDGKSTGEPLLAVDLMGAGLHQRVIISTDGRSIRERVHPNTPIRHFTIGIIDDMGKR